MELDYTTTTTEKVREVFTVNGENKEAYDSLIKGLTAIGQTQEHSIDDIPYTPSHPTIALYDGVSKLERQLFGITRTFFRNTLTKSIDEIASALTQVGATKSIADGIRIAQATARAQLPCKNGNELSWRPISEGSKMYKVSSYDPIGATY